MNNEPKNDRTGFESDHGYMPYQETQTSPESQTSSAWDNNTEDNRKANILCGISLACELLPMIVTALLSGVLFSFATNNSELEAAFETLMELVGYAGSLAMVIGLVIMIYVRVKYPQNVFGKVLMWMFIIGAIISVIIAILYALLLAVTCISCMSCLSDLR